VACGEASSSVSNGTNTSSSVASSTSAFANVTSVTLTAASDGLTQVVGNLKPVTVTAALNANTNPSTTIKWFVNGVQQSATGRTLTFTPTNSGTFNVTATVGDVMSNVLPVSVSSGVNVTSATFDSPSRILVVADSGANVTVTGATMANTSRYDLKTGTYIVDLERAVAQGGSVTVRLERTGGAPTTRTVVYDTRSISLDEIEITLESGATLTLDTKKPIKVIKPFGETEADITYSLAFVTENMFFSGQAPKTVKLETRVPTGAVAIPNEEFSVTNDPEAFLFEVKDNTVAGVYTHKLTIDGKSIEVSVEVLEPTPNSLTLGSYEPYLIEELGNELWDYETLKDPKFEGKPVVTLGQYDESLIDSEFSHDDTIDITDFLLPGADGIYQIVKPFETETNVLQFSFSYVAQNFAFDSDIGIQNYINVALEGPTEFLANSPLFAGIETSNEGAAFENSAFATLFTTGETFDDFNNGSSDYYLSEFIWKDDQEHIIGQVAQFIDAGTPEGVYTFTVSAGPLGTQKTTQVKLRVVKPAPKISFNFDNHNSDDTTRVYETDIVGNTITLYKPINESHEIDVQFNLLIQNYHSFAVDSSSLELANDLSIIEPTNRKLFNGSEIVDTTGDFDDNLIWFGQNSYDTSPQEVADLYAVEFVNSTYYRFVDLQLAISGLSGLYSQDAGVFKTLAEFSIPRERQAILKADEGQSVYKNVDESVEDFEDDHDIYDYYNSVFIREFEFLLNKNTPTGSSTLTLRVDNLSFTFTIVVKEPSYKLIIADEAGTSYLNSDDLAKDVGLDFDGDITTQVRNDGKFRVYIDEVDDALDILNTITVVDVKPGVYNWTVKREYPGGSSETSDSVTIVESDLTADDILNIVGLGVGSDISRSKFEDNFVVNRNDLVDSFIVGSYKYTFTFGSVTKVVEIEIIDNPKVVVNWIQIGDVVARPGSRIDNVIDVDFDLFNGKPLVDTPIYASLSLKNVILGDYVHVMSFIDYDWTDYLTFDDEEDLYNTEFNFNLIPETVLLGYLSANTEVVEDILEDTDVLVLNWYTNLFLNVQFNDDGLVDFDTTGGGDTDFFNPIGIESSEWFSYSNYVFINFITNKTVTNGEYGEALYEYHD
jgi:hypothetical protein